MTNTVRSLMSLAFKRLRPGQVLNTRFPCVAKQSISSVVVFGRSCLAEDFPGFIDITLSLCIIRVEHG